jgi:WD40 repeat protein
MRPTTRAVAATLLLLLAACAPPAPPPPPTATAAPTAAALAPTAFVLSPEGSVPPASPEQPRETATAVPLLPASPLPDPTATPPLPEELIDAATTGRLAPLRSVGLGGANGAAFTPDGAALAVGTTAGLAWLRLPGLTPARLDPVGGAYEVALSPNGTLLAHGVATADSAERSALRRAGDASLIFEMDGRNPAFSPDGLALVTSSLPYGAEQRAWLWSVSSSAPVAELAGGAPVWSPDGRFVATVEAPYDASPVTRLYDAADGGLLLELTATAPAFSPDGTQLAVTGAGQVELYGLAEADLRASVPVQDDAVSGFSADGARLLIVAGPDLIVWDLAAGAEAARFPAVNRSAEYGLVEGLSFAPDGGAVASLAPLLGDCPPGGVRVTATDDGRTLYEDNGSYQAVFSPDGGQLALNSGGAVRVVAMESGDSQALAFPAYEAVAFSPEGATMALSTVVGDGSGRTVGQVELWDVITSARRAALATDPDDFVYSLSGLRYSPDGARLSALARYGCAAVGMIKVITWDVASGRIVGEIDGIPPGLDSGAPTDRPPAVLAFAPDGSAAAWVDEEQQRLVLRRSDGAEAAIATEGPPTALAFSPDGAKLAVGHAEGNVSLLAVGSGEVEPLSIDLGDRPDPSVRQLFYSADGALLLVRTGGGSVFVVGAAGEQPQQLQLGAGFEILGLSADKGYLLAKLARSAIASDEGGVLFCELAGAGCVGQVDGAANDAALGPGRRLIAAVQDGRVVLWGVR